MKKNSSCITLTVIDNHNMVEEIRVSIIINIIKISNVKMYILCDLKGQCLNHDHVAHVYKFKGAECSKLRQPMRAIFALSRAQLLLLVFTRSRDLSRECHVTKHKTPAKSNFPLSNFENSGTIPFSSSSYTSRRLCPKNFDIRAHPTGDCSKTVGENIFFSLIWACMQDTFARARNRPKGYAAARPSAPATIGYILPAL